MKKIAILGCGPAGLLAAHAAHITRVKADVFSIGEKSAINGAQFLHSPIPALTDTGPDGWIEVIKRGDSRGYAKKVYGSEDAPCSFHLLKEDIIPAWSLSKTYDSLWDFYVDDIIPELIEPVGVMKLSREYDMVISTVPRKVLCYRAHEFPCQRVLFTNGLPLIHDDNPPMGPNYIVYSGDAQDHWYRASRIFGVEQTEWPSNADEISHLIEGIKPLSTNCDCMKDVMKIGRFGKWEKGVLVHHAFQEAVNALQSL